MGFYIVGGIKINSTLIPYESANVSPELQKMLLNSDARAGHSFTGIETAEPMVKVTTPALASVLDIVGLGGAVLTAVEVYLIKHGSVGLTSGSAHRKLSGTAAVVRVDSISAGKGAAKLVIEIYASEDGTNAAWVLTDGVALPTSPRVTDVWYQGPLYLDDTEYEIEESTFSPNQEVIKRHSNGDVGPSFIGLLPSKPTMSVKSADGILHGLADAYGANVGPVTLFYRKGSEGDGLRVADATATHISLTIPSALMTPDGIDGTPGKAVEFGVMFDARDDGTNSLVTLDTTTAIAAPA